MSDSHSICLPRAVISAASERAEKQGLSTEDFVMQILMRELEIGPDERTVLAYDAAEPGFPSVLEREEDESDEHYQNRSSALRALFP